MLWVDRCEVPGQDRIAVEIRDGRATTGAQSLGLQSRSLVGGYGPCRSLNDRLVLLLARPSCKLGKLDAPGRSESYDVASTRSSADSRYNSVHPSGFMYTRQPRGGPPRDISPELPDPAFRTLCHAFGLYGCICAIPPPTRDLRYTQIFILISPINVLPPSGLLFACFILSFSETIKQNCSLHS